jgi:hypothetical protein
MRRSRERNELDDDIEVLDALEKARLFVEYEELQELRRRAATITPDGTRVVSDGQRRKDHDS